MRHPVFEIGDQVTATAAFVRKCRRAAGAENGPKSGPRNKKPARLRTGVLIWVLWLWLAWLGSLERASGSWELRIYKPRNVTLTSTNEYWFDHASAPPVDVWIPPGQPPPLVMYRNAANCTNGGIALRIQGANGHASVMGWITVDFDVTVTQRCYVYVTASLTNASCTPSVGLGCFAGTRWGWSVDDGSWHFHDIDPTITWMKVGEQVVVAELMAIDIAVAIGTAAVVFGTPVGWAALALDGLILFVEAGTELKMVYGEIAKLKEWHEHTETFHTVVEPGSHTLSVGAEAHFHAGPLGGVAGLVFLNIGEIRLGINTQGGLHPDLTIGGIIVENEDNLRRGAQTHVTTELLNIGNSQAYLGGYDLVAIPTSGPVETIRPAGAPWFITDAYTWREDKCTWYPQQKSKYTLQAVANRDLMVTDEITLTNNLLTKEVVVRGSPPQTPDTPYCPAATTYRNQPLTFSTWSQDPDNDPIYYLFQARAEGDTNWFWVVNPANGNTNYWSLSTNITLTPVLAADTELYPRPGSAGGDLQTWLPLPTNRFYIRVIAADTDGNSAPSAATVIDFANTLPTDPAVFGPAAGSTLVPYVLTVTNSDAEGDPVGFRFKWGDKPGEAWSDWQWCPAGQPSLTVSHIYGVPSDLSPPYHYDIYVQATDLYSYRYGGGTTSAVKKSVTITNYFATATLLVVTKDADSGLPLGRVAGYIDGHPIAQPYPFFTTGPYGTHSTTTYPGITNYTVIFSNVDGYITPSAQTQSLAVGNTNASLQFVGLYRHKVGTIRVDSNISAAGSITGSGSAAGNNYQFLGSSWATSQAWAGDYTLAFAAADPTHYSLPIPARLTNTLAEGGWLTCTGHYYQRPLASLVRTYPTNNYNPPNSFVLVWEESVLLDGSGSRGQELGPDGQPAPIIQYQFSADDRRSYTESTNGAPDGQFDGKVAFAFSQPGRHRQVSLTVTDANGVTNWLTDPVEVWVKARPTAALSFGPTPAIAGETVVFSGSAQPGNSGDSILRYEWTGRAGQVFSTDSSLTTNFNPGVYPVSFRAQADDLVWSAPAADTLTVMPPREWPSFKCEERRGGCQLPYDNRAYGQLTFQPWNPGAFRFINDAIQGSPVVANLDSNYANGLEIVFATTNGTLYVTDRYGLWHWSRSIGPSSSTPAIGDVNGDGQPDIVVGTRTNVWCFDWQGNTNYSYSYTLSDTPCRFEYSMPLIAAIDPTAPGRQVAITADDGSVHLIYADGTTTNLWPHVPAVAFVPADPMFAPSPAAAALDLRFGGKQVVVGSLTGEVLVFDYLGQLIASNRIPTGAEIHTTPAIAAICPSLPGMEIVLGADDGVVYCFNFNDTNTIAPVLPAQPGLTPVWQYTNFPPAKVRSSPVVAVLGEYPVPEVAFGCDNGQVSALIGTNGHLLGSYNCGASVRATPAIANIDTLSNTQGPMGDRPEVIVGAINGTLYAIDFFSAVPPSPQVLWSNQLGLSQSPIYSSPAVADLDHDPDLEILVGKNDGALYVLKAQPMPAFAPIPNFSMTPTSGSRPLTVTFTDRSTNGPTAWYWDFGDGSTSNNKNPTHTYQVPGTYLVALTAGNANGTRTLTNATPVTVYPAPLADFSGSPLFGYLPLIVQFTNLSKYGAPSFTWSFGDGGTSSDQNPAHPYTAAGVYTVTLTASNMYGVAVETKTKYLAVRAVCPVADFTQSVNYGCTPLGVSFTDLSANTPTTWLWDFDDGTTSTAQNPSHIYHTAGRFLVSLTVSNAAGTDAKVNLYALTVLPGAAASYVPALDLQFDEGSGATAFDATTNHNDGTISGAAWTDLGNNQFALLFHGGGQWADGDAVTVPHSAALDISGPFSVVARIKTGASDQYLAIVDQYLFNVTSNQAAGFTLYLTDGLLRFSLYSGEYGNAGCWGTNDLRDDTWHRVQATWDGTSLRNYVDDVLQGECAWAYPPAPTTQDLGVGKRLSGWGGYMPFSGLIDYASVSHLQVVAPPRPELVVLPFGNQLMISWDSCGVLQSAPALTGPWTDVAEASNPYVFTPTAGQAFYRLRP